MCFSATNNVKVKETVALELSFFNSNLQLLKEELSVLNSQITPYQNERYIIMLCTCNGLTKWYIQYIFSLLCSMTEVY